MSHEQQPLAMTRSLFFFGDWQVNPANNSLQHDKHLLTLEPKAMDVLCELCKNPGEVLSAETLLERCWPGVVLGDNPVHKCLAQLRKALGDDANAPRYIETIRKRGYRTVAKVEFPAGHEQTAVTASWEKGSPFPGLRAFQSRDAEVFYGRSDAVTQLLKSISVQWRAGRALNLVLGPSGSGKTSLVNAGVIPNLCATHGFDGIHVVSVASIDMADVSPNQVMLDLASALLDWEYQNEPLFAGLSAEQLAHELSQNLDKLTALLQSQFNEATQKIELPLLFIDRLEVLLGADAYSEETRLCVLRILEKLALSKCAIVITTCRNDFYPQLAQYKALMAGKVTGAHFDLQAPSRAELLQMIRLPAKAAGLVWEDNGTEFLDQLLCDDAADNTDALPMLQYTLNELYQQRSEDKVLKLDVYQSLGGIEGAIGKRAEAIVTELPENVRAALPSIFAKLVTLSKDEKSITSRTALWSQLHSEAEQQLVQTLVDNRLLVSHLVGEEPGFSLAHEALLRKWQRAVDWIQQHRENLKALSRIQLAAERWQNESEAKEFLLPSGKPLFEAKEIRSNPLFELTETEQRFITVSNKRSGFRKTLQRGTIALLAALTLVSIVMTVRSIDSEKRAEQRREQADDLLGYMVGEFADKVRPLGRLDLLGGVSEKALNYLNDDEDNLSDNTRLQHAKASAVFGEVRLSQGQLAESEAAYQLAISNLQKLHAANTENSAVIKELGIASFWLGQIALDSGRLNETKSRFEEYRKYSDHYAELNPSEVDAWKEQSFSRSSLGTVHLKTGNVELAKEAFSEAIDLKFKVLKLQPEDRTNKASLANTLSWVATLNQDHGNFSIARENYLEESRLLDELIQEAPSEAEWLWQRAMSAFRLSELESAMGQIERAHPLLMKSKQLLTTIIHKDPSNLDWQRQLIGIELEVLSQQMEQSEPGNIQLSLSDIIARMENLKLAGLGKQKLLGNSVQIQQLKAKALIKQAEFTSAKEALDHALNELKLDEVSKGDADTDPVLIISTLLLKARTLILENEKRQAVETCASALPFFENTIHSNSDLPSLALWIQINICLGRHNDVRHLLAKLDAVGYQERAFLDAVKFFSHPQ